MNKGNSQLIGWVQALISVTIFFGINNVVTRYSAVILEVNPIIYSCVAFSSCALILLAYAGYGKLARETIRSIDTWVYGTVLIMGYIVGMVLFEYVTSTERNMLQRLSVFITLVSGWFFLGRNPDRHQLVGTTIITAGVIMVCVGINDSFKVPVYFLAVTYAALQGIRIIAAELHRPHKQATQEKTTDPKAKARVVGFVMFVISLLFLFIAFLVALAQNYQGEIFSERLPKLTDFTHPATIFAGFITGILLTAPIRLLEFSSTSIIKSENFTAATSFAFVATLFWETITSPITGLSMKTLTTTDIMAGVLITVGGLFIALTRRYKHNTAQKWQEYLYYAGQYPEHVADSREILAGTLEHFNNNIKKSANALGVIPSALEALLVDKEKVLAFRSKVLPEVARNYRKQVAMADSLTGLANRSAFLTALRSAAYETETYSVLYLDLDKFKPVNDTYGHEAGDKILQGVAERLQNAVPKNSVITRMGGDEYCILLLNISKEDAQKLAAKAQAVIAKPFKLKGITDTIKVTASIGVANYPEDSDNHSDLLQIADKGMFGVKHSRDK